MNSDQLEQKIQSCLEAPIGWALRRSTRRRRILAMPFALLATVAMCFPAWLAILYVMMLMAYEMTDDAKQK